MPSRRPSDTDSRERLLKAGLEQARRIGLRRLTVRGVATQAGANLGSFVHHFGSRDAFVGELIERLYAPMLARLELDARSGGDALENLRRAVLQVAAWVVAQRDFIAHLLLDASAGEAAAQRFLQSLDGRHPALLLALVRQAQQAGRLRRDDPLHQLLFLMSTLALPAMAFHLIGQRGLAPPLARALAPYTVEPAQIEIRLGWALRALAPVEAPA